MEEYPHLSEATISTENVEQAQKYIEKVKDTVKEAANNISTSLEDKELEKDSNSNKNEQEHFEFKKVPEITKNIVQPLGSLFGSFVKKGEEVKEYYKDDVNELVTNLKDDATNTVAALNEGFNKLSLSIGNGLFSSNNQDKDKSSEETKNQSGFSLFSALSSITKSSGLTEYAEKISKSTGLSEYAEKISNNPMINQYADKISEGVNNFIKHAVVIEAPDETEANEKRILFDRKQAKILKLQSNTYTYIIDPETDDAKRADYLTFLETFDPSDYINEKNDILKANPEMARIFDKLVPAEMNEDTFWKRYYFSLHNLEVEELERKKLLKETIDQETELFKWDESETESENESDLTISNKNQDVTKSTELAQIDRSAITSNSQPAERQESYELVEDNENIATPKTEELAKGLEINCDKSEDDDWGTWE